MANKPADKQPDEGAHQTSAPTRYRVLSGGITAQLGRPVAAYRKGDTVTGEDLGDSARVAKLLARKAIEEVRDNAD